MTDVKTPVAKTDIQEAIKAIFLRKDVIVCVVIGLLVVGFNLSTRDKSQSSAVQPGTQAWCVMNGQKEYRELMKEFGFTLPQSQALITKCAKLFEVTGGTNAKVFKDHQAGMKNQTTPVTVGGY